MPRLCWCICNGFSLTFIKVSFPEPNPKPLRILTAYPVNMLFHTHTQTHTQTCTHTISATPLKLQKHMNVAFCELSNIST